MHRNNGSRINHLFKSLNNPKILLLFNLLYTLLALPAQARAHMDYKLVKFSTKDKS